MYDAKEKMVLASRPCCPIHPDRRCFGGIGASCSWWVERKNRCAVAIIAQNIGSRQKGAGSVQKKETL